MGALAEHCLKTNSHRNAIKLSESAALKALGLLCWLPHRSDCWWQCTSGKLGGQNSLRINAECTGQSLPQ
jgi:hypothetical protein